MKKELLYIIILFFISTATKADNVNKWLGSELDSIIDTYNNSSLTNEDRFKKIEKSINNNFAGSGIAKFVAGKAWSLSNKETQKKYISLFKRHLALNIASIMKGYSNQSYSFNKTIKDEKNDSYLIEMEIKDNSNTILVTWRAKQSKEKFYIIDLIVADISLVRTKRSEFNSILKKIDYDLKEFNSLLEERNNLSYNKIINN